MNLPNASLRSRRGDDVSDIPVVRSFELWARPYIRRAHLPRSPWGPAVHVVIGLVGIGLIGGLLDDDIMRNRPLAVAAMAFGAAIMVPALGMAMVGAWDLVREPLRHFFPDWHARLVPAAQQGRRRTGSNPARVASSRNPQRSTHVRASPVHGPREGQRRSQRHH